MPWLRGFNTLPNNKYLDLSKLKAFADDKINVTKILKFGLGRVENTVVFFSHNAVKGFFLKVIKSRNYHLCGKQLNAITTQYQVITIFFIYTHFNTLNRKDLGKHGGKS